MKFLFIAPLPLENTGHPITGNSLPIFKTIEYLKSIGHEIYTVDLSHNDVLTKNYLIRSIQILNVLYQTYKKSKNVDIIYLTNAESFTGNIRDLFIYGLCFAKLNKFVIHMLGGNSMKTILKPRFSIQFHLNKFFLSKVRVIIVEGQIQKQTFSQVTETSKIHINPNFAEDYLFINEIDVREKYKNTNKFRILFLSNLLDGKGHEELASAFLSLPENYKNIIEIDFVGNFVEEHKKERFQERIKGEVNLIYHGPLSGEAKRKMYQQSHVFCLPTYYPYEGQPFCIVESYAAGCMVITTNHSGIGQIFKDNINGYEVEKKSIESLKNAIIKAVDNKHTVMDFALNNLNEAKEKYTLQKYLETQQTILETVK